MMSSGGTRVPIVIWTRASYFLLGAGPRYFIYLMFTLWQLFYANGECFVIFEGFRFEKD